MNRRAEASDAGSASVLLLSLTAVLGLVAALFSLLGGVAVARHRAAAAADLSALAAAGLALDGAGPACAAADRIASAQGAVLLACAVDGEIVQVRVGIRPGGLPGRLGLARASARAGPALQ